MPRAKRAQVPTTEPPAKPVTSTSVVVEKKSSRSNGNAKAPSELEQAIRSRAYELYEERGRQDGFAQQDWLKAEAEVLSRYSRTA